MDQDRELMITRLIDASREQIFEAWTRPELLSQWWAPRPYTTPGVEIEAYPGGRFRTDMRDPEGTDYPNQGVFLEIVPNEKIVVTDAFTVGWVPNPKPFVTIVITLEDEAGKTRYTARVRHWTVEDRDRHEKMGFHDGWGQALTQLEELLARGERV